MATASASAAWSGRGGAGSRAASATMRATCSLPARPLPQTAPLTCCGRVADARHAALAGGEHHDAARLADGEGAARVRAEVQLLERHRVGLVLAEQRVHRVVDLGEPPLRRQAGGRLDHAAVERDEPPAAAGDDAVAGVGEARVYAEHDHAGT